MRLRGLVRKEFLQIRRDPSSIAIAFVMPVVLLLLFGYGVSLDVEDAPIGIVIEEPSHDADDFVAALRGSDYFDTTILANMEAAEAALLAGRIDGVVRLRGNFAGALRGDDPAPVQVIVDGVDANTGRLITGYVQGAWATWLGRQARSQGRDLERPVALEQRVWFNAEMRSRNFIVPGLIAIIMTLIGALLTAMVMAREWERGTMEALMVTPVAMRELLLGKLVPYFVLGMGGLTLSVAMALFLFDVPLRGSLLLLGAASMLFMLVALGMGMLISILAKNQFVAGQVAILVTFLPAFILSGFIFDIGSMPGVVQALTHVIAARYFVAILKTLFLAGNVWPVVLANAAALAALALVLFGLIARRARKRLD